MPIETTGDIKFLFEVEVNFNQYSIIHYVFSHSSVDAECIVLSSFTKNKTPRFVKAKRSDGRIQSEKCKHAHRDGWRLIGMDGSNRIVFQKSDSNSVTIHSLDVKFDCATSYIHEAWEKLS